MMPIRPPHRMRTELVAVLAVLALAGCGGGGGGGGGDGGGGGGGGGGTPPPAGVAVASITLPATNGIAIVGAQKTIPAVVKGTDGSTLTDRTISWTSSNATVGTVAATGAQGVASPLATGATTITATVEGVSASMALDVKAAPANFTEFKALFPHTAPGAGGFVVASEITPGYSAGQLDHLMKSWNHFTGFFPKAPGSHTEMYYTWDPALLEYAKANFPECNSALAQLPGRRLLTCSESPMVSWIVAPNLDGNGGVPADLASGLASVSQSFMDSIPPADRLYGWPWLWEGLSYAFKSGDFADGPSYTMRALADPERTAFKQALNAGTLLALESLVDLTRTRTVPPTGTWFAHQQVAEAQSSMLLNYLYRTYPTELKSLFAAIDAGAITTSQGAFGFILSEIGKTAAELDAAYKAYGAGL